MSTKIKIKLTIKEGRVCIKKLTEIQKIIEIAHFLLGNGFVLCWQRYYNKKHRLYFLKTAIGEALSCYLSGWAEMLSEIL